MSISKKISGGARIRSFPQDGGAGSSSLSAACGFSSGASPFHNNTSHNSSSNSVVAAAGYVINNNSSAAVSSSHSSGGSNIVYVSRNSSGGGTRRTQQQQQQQQHRSVSSSDTGIQSVAGEAVEKKEERRQRSPPAVQPKRSKKNSPPPEHVARGSRGMAMKTQAHIRKTAKAAAACCTAAAAASGGDDDDDEDCFEKKDPKAAVSKTRITFEPNMILESYAAQHVWRQSPLRTSSDREVSQICDEADDIHTAALVARLTLSLAIAAPHLSQPPSPQLSPVPPPAQPRHFFFASSIPNIEPNCPICFQAFMPETVVASMGCSHYFHRECLARWVVNTPNCPLCRREASNQPEPIEREPTGHSPPRIAPVTFHVGFPPSVARPVPVRESLRRFRHTNLNHSAPNYTNLNHSGPNYTNLNHSSSNHLGAVSNH